ncbi:MAG: hypothetical protein J2P15_16670 [Micromonosporaceae bacterium]|nr:hypothetical protein [Micromonosporaceae bacterium]
MRYLLLMCGEGRDEPSPAEIVAMPDFIGWEARLRERGLPHQGVRLRPPGSAATVRLRAAEMLVTDGPFAETREQMGGFEILDCAGPDEAIEVAAGHPGAMHGNRVEVRSLAGPATGGEHALVELARTGPPPGRHRYLMMVCLDPAAQPEPAAETIGGWVEQMSRNGVWRYGQRLGPASEATMVSTMDGKVLTTDGPFAAAAEQIVEIGVLECASLAEATTVAATHPVAAVGCVEVRPFWEE